MRVQALVQRRVPWQIQPHNAPPAARVRLSKCVSITCPILGTFKLLCVYDPMIH